MNTVYIIHIKGYTGSPGGANPRRGKQQRSNSAIYNVISSSEEMSDDSGRTSCGFFICAATYGDVVQTLRNR